MRSIFFLIPIISVAATVPADISGVRPGPITVVATAESIMVRWPDEASRNVRKFECATPRAATGVNGTSGHRSLPRAIGPCATHTQHRIRDKREPPGAASRIWGGSALTQAAVL
jgi:hypothetical protein